MGCSKCNKESVQLIPTIDELRMRLETCGSDIRAKDMHYLLNYLEYLEKCCNGNLTNIDEVILTEKEDCILELEQLTASPYCYGIIITENNRV